MNPANIYENAIKLAGKDPILPERQQVQAFSVLKDLYDRVERARTEIHSTHSELNRVETKLSHEDGKKAFDLAFKKYTAVDKAIADLDVALRELTKTFSGADPATRLSR